MHWQRLHVVLVERESKRSRRDGDPVQWQGRSDTNKRVLFCDAVVPTTASIALAALRVGIAAPSSSARSPQPGDYVLCEIAQDGAGPSSLKSRPLAITTLREAVELCINADDKHQRGAMFVESREAWLWCTRDLVLDSNGLSPPGCREAMAL